MARGGRDRGTWGGPLALLRGLLASRRERRRLRDIAPALQQGTREPPERDWAGERGRSVHEAVAAARKARLGRPGVRGRGPYTEEDLPL